MGKRIYADNAATTMLSNKAYKTMLPYLMEDFGNASQLYSFARGPKKAIKEARATIADCIGAQPEEIFFTSCGTESDNWVISGAMSKNLNVVTSTIEHHAILRPCKHFSDRGLSVKFLPVDDKGLINVSTLEETIEAENTLVSIMFANNEIGSIQPISELVKVTHSKGCLFHTDAVQAIGHTMINVNDLGVDMMSASAHKFNGPKGIGFLYIRKGIEWPSLIMGGSQECGHRAGTENVAAIVGMAVALQENITTIHENDKHLHELENCLLEELIDSGAKFIRNGSDIRIPGNISLSFQGFIGESIMHRLDLQGIYISTGSACNSEETELSHVLCAIGMDEELAKGTIRISLGKNNTLEESKLIGKALVKIIKP